MSTIIAKPTKVAIIGASGTYGRGILARAEEIGVQAVVVTRSPHKFRNVKPTTTVVDARLDDEEKLKQAFGDCDGVISALGDDRKTRPKTQYLPHVWNAMKAAGVTKYVGMGRQHRIGSGAHRPRNTLPGRDTSAQDAPKGAASGGVRWPGSTRSRPTCIECRFICRSSTCSSIIS